MKLISQGFSDLISFEFSVLHRCFCILIRRKSGEPSDFSTETHQRDKHIDCVSATYVGPIKSDYQTDI